MGHNKYAIFLLLAIVQTCFAPPVTQTKKEGEGQQPDSEMGGLEDYMEYHRYLKEVVNALESDPEFRQKLEKADESDIKSGKIAEELQFVSHHVRNKLDELKRLELQRLKELTEKKIKLEQGTNNIVDPTHHHLDQSNLHTFEIEDLKKLIKKTTDDLAEADKARKEEFKHYELEKEYQKQEKLNHSNGNEREKLENGYQEMEEKHKNHQKLHEPGHKAQLEEVWEEQDQMQQDFDPKTFFMLHDIDGNGLWDQEEVKALFIKELDKMYQQGAPEDDMRERVEEMERMRESVFEQMDRNRDGFIDYGEFLQQTKTNNFEQDHGWQSLDEQTRPYTDEELAEYIRQHHAANEIPRYGQVPQYPPQAIHPDAYQQVPPGAYHQVPPGGYQPPPNQQFHPGQVPQMAPQALDLNTNEINPGQQQYHNPQYQQYQQQNVPQHNPPQYQQQNIPQQNIPQQKPSQYQQQNVANKQYPNAQQNQQPNQPNVPPRQTNMNNPPQQNPPQYQQSNIANSQQNAPNQQPNPNNHQQQPNVRQQQIHVSQQQENQQQPNVQQTK